MLEISFTAEEIEAIKKAKKEEKHLRIKQRIEVVLLKSENYPHKEIAKVQGLCKNTVRKYLREYKAGGLPAILKGMKDRKTSELDVYKDMLKEHFTKHPPSNVHVAIEEIKRLTGIVRRPTQVREWLKKLGMAYRKVGSLPKKADPDVQEEFKKKSWFPY